MAQSIVAVFFFFSSMGVEMPSCFVAFLCFVMDALRIAGPPWDTIRRTDWELSVMSLFSSSGSCTCHNYRLHRALTWIKSVIFHWWMSCWLHATHHFSCHPISLVHAVRAPISISCSLLLSCPLFLCDIWRGHSSPPSSHPWIKCHGLTSCSFQGLEKTTSKMVSPINVFYLSTISNVAGKDVTRVMQYTQSHLVEWYCQAALFDLDTHSLWHSEP